MEKALKSKTVWRGRFLAFKSDEVELPDGRVTVRDIVEHPGAVAIIPILSDGRILLVRQYRYAVDKELLEIPAGTMERGESPKECAARELSEETGYEAERMEELTRFYTAPGYSSELIYLFMAEGLKPCPRSLEEDEEIRVEAFELDQVLEMISRHIIEDGKTICGVLYLDYVKNLGKF
ncbi:NUDIX hydrolase [Candidatus Bathyarchaeota archaeon]|nr:NUDIX hydrolase [Candidatus Bathyarchaeota archaeon]